MPTIYEIEEQYREILDEIFFETDEEAIELLYARLHAVKGSAKDKISIVATMLCETMEVIESRKRVYERAKARYESAKKRSEWMREYIKNGMTKLDIKKVENDYCTISQRTYEKLVFDDGFDVGQLPEQYKKTVLKVTPMTKEIKAALKEGKSIDGAGIVKEQSITLRR